MLALIVFFWLATAALMPYVEQMKEAGYAGAFVISLVSSASIIIPTPGFVAVVELGKVLNPLLLGIVAGIGSAIGEMSGYYAGKQERENVRKSGIYLHHEAAIRRWGPLGMFFLALIPNPFLDFAGIACGAIGMPAWQFAISVSCAKIIKYTAFAYTGAILF